MSVHQVISELTPSTRGESAVLLPSPSRYSDAVRDLAGGLSRSWIWTRLAYQDIRERYRGSVLGPFWVTLTNLIMIAALGGIYSELFHQDIKAFIPYLMTGLTIWQYISGMIAEGCSTFTSARDVIQQVPMPFSVQAYRVVYRNLIVLAHNAVIIPFGLVLFEVPIDWHILEILPALALLSLNGLWMSILLGIVSTRFRDIPPIVTNVVQVLFFLTPIFWPVDSVKNLRDILVLNPFFAWIDVARAPMLGMAPEPTSWPILIGCTALGGVISFLFFARFRERIAYWI